MYGTPVLGADIGGIPELIQEGKTGELFESGNIVALKKSIQILWDKSKRFDKCSKNSGNVNFDNAERYAEKLIRIYIQPTFAQLVD